MNSELHQIIGLEFLRKEERLALSQVWDWVFTKAEYYLDLAEQEGITQKIELIKGKILHTYDVIGAMASIYPPKGIGDSSYGQALIVAAAHDVARFPQIAIQGNCSDAGYDHGIEGQRMLLEEVSPLPGFNMTKIAWAINLHNKIDEESKANPLSSYLCDADKIAILSRPEVFMMELFGVRSVEEEIQLEDEEDRKISAEVLEIFLSGKPIPYSKSVSLIDELIIKLAWIFDLNYSSSRCMFIKQGLPQSLLQIIKIVNKDCHPDEIRIIAEKVEDWICANDEE